jgi:N-acetylglucosamine malate deacetylase 1
MKRILVVSPHPDDETLGCGGTLLRHVAEGDEVHWLNITGISQEHGFSQERVLERTAEIKEVRTQYRMASLNDLGFPTTQLDQLPLGDIIGKISDVFTAVKPETLYLPYRYDIHTDHKVVFDAVAACTKWFRHPSVKRVLAYETLSETDFQLSPCQSGFTPNVFIDVEDYLEKKIDILKIYRNELGEFPFPRSEKAVRSLAALRGASSGFESAESFVLLKERIN